MKINSFDEITPERLVEIDLEVENIRIHDLTLDSLQKHSQERLHALAQYENIELQCKIRALAAHNLGFSKAELARIFNVTTNEINKWIG